MKREGISGLTPFVGADGKIKYKIKDIILCNGEKLYYDDNANDVNEAIEKLKDPKTILMQTCEATSVFKCSDGMISIEWETELKNDGYDRRVKIEEGIEK